MAATVTASIASLILTLDDPDRDDLDSVTVWGSTTSGFTPSNANVVYKGKSLSITIANLTPLTTYYLKYAYISAIDPTDYVVSSELSGTPSKIDGGVIVDNLRGKTLAGSVVIDGGSVVTAAVAKPATVNATTTVNVQDASDFPTSGGAIVISRNTGFNKNIQFRYTGKTATSLTGVSGLEWSIAAGDAVIPQPLPSFTIDSYTVGGALDTSSSANFLFRRTGGSALAISISRAANLFTYTAGHTLAGSVYSSVLAGVSGLSAFSLGQGSRATIIDAISLVTTTVATTGAVATLTLSAATEYLRSGGGKMLLVSTTVSGIKKVSYSAYSGTTVTLDSSTTLTAATYYVIPLYSYNVIGSDIFALVSYNNAYNAEWQHSYLSSDIDVSNNISENLELSPSAGYGLTIWPSDKASEFDAPAVKLGSPDSTLHISINPISYSAIDTNWMLNLGDQYILGASKLSSGYTNPFLTAYDGSALLQYQPISTTVRFSGYDVASLDAITFDNTSNTYAFSADGGTGNAALFAASMNVGHASDTALARSAAGVLSVAGGIIPKQDRANSYTANQTIVSANFRMGQNTTVLANGDAVAPSVNAVTMWSGNNGPPTIVMGYQVNSASGTWLRSYKSRGGNVATMTAASSGDTILGIDGHIYDSAAFQNTAEILFSVDGAVSAGVAPGKISLSTGATDTASLKERLRIDSAGNILNVSSGGLGYGTGSGGAVTQATSRTTGVTLNKTNGFIILVSAAGSTSWQSFTVTNSTVAGTDTIIVHQRSGTDLYEVHVTSVSAGAFRVMFRTTGGTTTEQPVFVFSVIKSVTA